LAGGNHAHAGRHGIFRAEDRDEHLARLQIGAISTLAIVMAAASDW